MAAGGGAPPPMMQQQAQPQPQQQGQGQQFMGNPAAAAAAAGYMNIHQGPNIQAQQQALQAAQVQAAQAQAVQAQYVGPPPPPPQGYMYQGGYGMPPGAGAMQGQPGMMPAAAGAPGLEPIRNVWRWNLEEQMGILRKLVERFNYIFIDCKFPGIVARPIGTFKSTSEYHYQTLRSNVDILEVIQIGITLTDEYGNQPPGGIATWQFNFKFDPSQDMASSEGIELLRQSGIDFMKHEMEGIDPFAFGELIFSSGFVLNDQVNWVTFHSGYDLGYLLSILLNKEVPVEERGFLKTLKKYFPNIYDVKYICKNGFNIAKSNLFEIADELNIRLPMIGMNGINQAGLDSLLTNGIFANLRQQHPDTILKLRGNLFGLGENIEENGTNTTSAAVHNQSAANLFQFGKMGGGASS